MCASLLAPSSPLPLLIKAIGLLVNLTQDGSSDWSDVMEQTSIVVAMETLLRSCGGPGGAGGSGGVVEQCLCVLVNWSSCSEKTRELLVHREEILHSVSTVLVNNNNNNNNNNNKTMMCLCCVLQRSSNNVAVLMAAVEFVRNLVATDKEGVYVPS